MSRMTHHRSMLFLLGLKFSQGLDSRGMLLFVVLTHVMLAVYADMYWKQAILAMVSR